LALPTYRRGIRHDAFDVALLVNAARLSGDAGRFAEAGRLWRRAAALDPSNPDTTARCATFLAAHGDPQAALSILARPLALFPDTAALWAAAGDARAATQDVEGARRAYERALALQPDLATAKSALSRLPST
jgi:predicted Zn-dependent protease